MAMMAPSPSRTTRLGLCLGLLASILGMGHEARAQQAHDGQSLYMTTCSACHQGEGTGVAGAFPPLAGSDWVTGDKGRLIRIILHGLTGPIEVKGEAFAGTMAPFGGALDNAAVAAVANYIRSSWGNDAPAITAAEVARVRRREGNRTRPWTAAELNAIMAEK